MFPKGQDVYASFIGFLSLFRTKVVNGKGKNILWLVMQQ